ncbi:MAG TPA: M67 family metallopeptidase [Rhizomicrobium sp.]|jgi:proteasome lid subunit RPN8/RPN11
MDRLALAPGLRAQFEREARAAFPRECCGLIEGVREGNEYRVRALHPTRNLAADADRFEVDPAAHLTLQRRLRGTGRAVLGCYHSHPNGAAWPSVWDGGHDGDFVWLIAGLDAGGIRAVSAHLRVGASWEALELAPSQLDPSPGPTL